jgi:hypothetical protein
MRARKVKKLEQNLFQDSATFTGKPRGFKTAERKLRNYPSGTTTYNQAE